MKEHIRTLVAHYPDQFNKAMGNPKLEGWFVGKLMSQFGGKMNPREISTAVSDYFVKMRRGYDVMGWDTTIAANASPKESDERITALEDLVYEMVADLSKNRFKVINKDGDKGTMKLYYPNHKTSRCNCK